MDRPRASIKIDFTRQSILNKLQDSIKDFAEDAELFDKLQVDSDNTSINTLLGALNDLLEDGFSAGPSSRDEHHYWPVIRATFDTRKMQFIENLEEYPTDSAKAYVWLLVELNDKHIPALFDDILKNDKILARYTDQSLLKVKATKVQNLLKQLDNTNYKIESKFLNLFRAELSDRKKSYQQDLYIPKKSISAQVSSDLDKYKQLLGRKETEDNFDTPYVNPNARPSELPSEKPNKLQEFSKKVILSTGDYLIKKPVEQLIKIPGNLLKIPQFFKKNENDTKDDGVKKGGRRRSASNERTNNEENDHWDDGAQTPEPKLKNLANGVTNVIKMPFIKGAGLIQKLNFFKSDKTPDGQDDDNRSQSTPGPKDGATFNPDDKDYQEYLEQARAGRLKHSQILFIEQFRGRELAYRDPPTQVTKPEDQEYKCYGCQGELSKMMLMIKNKSFFCHYTGRWYCYECMSKEKTIIPWYVKESFDFKTYNICNTAYKELKDLFNKPIMQIDYKSNIVQKNKILYEALVMRRQLHLMFDLICDTVIMMDVFNTNYNLLLKDNILSLKQLREIKDGNLIKYMEMKYNQINKHMTSCSSCLQKAKPCTICWKDGKIFVYDIKNTSVCHKCKTIYHLKCFQQHGCSVCKHDN